MQVLVVGYTAGAHIRYTPLQTAVISPPGKKWLPDWFHLFFSGNQNSGNMKKCLHHDSKKNIIFREKHVFS